MTGQQYVNRLVRYMLKPQSAPNDLTTTISYYDGQHTITLAADTGTPGAWAGCVIQLGAPIWDSTIIANNFGKTVILYSKFDPESLPTIGSTVTLTSKPISQTDWKGFARQEVDYESAQGVVSFGTITLADMIEGTGGIGRDVATSGGHAIRRTYTAAIFLEVNEIVGATADENMTAAMILPNLTEQTLFQLRQFCGPFNAGFYPIDTNRYANVVYDSSYQRDGGQKVNVVGIKFTVEYRR